MDHTVTLRDFIATLLQERGQCSSFTDDDSLFLSGRLDSLALVKLYFFLEAHFQLDCQKQKLKVHELDTLLLISRLANRG